MNETKNTLPASTNDSWLSRLNLRGKLTLANMTITFLVILAMGLYVYFRIQEGGKQLVSRLDESIRTQAQADLQSTSREQSALLESFFEGMRRNTFILGSSIQSMLDEKENLGSSTNWDARTALSRLSSGSWDNANTEISSIFIPAAVQLSDPLATKLNLLKHSELIFPSMLKGNPDIVAIYFGGTYRETVYYPNIDLANIVPPDFDVTGRQWFVDAVPKNNPTGDVVWSAPYQDAALNGLVITASVPVLDVKGSFQGVTAMDIQLTRITDIVSSIKVGKTGYALLLDESNRLIALPTSGFADFGITDASAQLGEIMDTSTLPAASPEIFDILNTVGQNNQGIFNNTLNGTERYIAYNTIPQVKYKLVIIVPTQELLSGTTVLSGQIAAETKNTRNFSILLIFVIFIVATAGSFAISNRLTTPLKSLNDVANELINGNFEAKADIKSGDELETLGVTLNNMTDTVRNLVSSLEERVTERTAELETEIRLRERRGKQYEAVARVAKALNTRQNLPELLPQITEVISQQFGFYHVGIFLTNPTSQYAILAAANSEGGKRMVRRGHQLKIGEQGIVGYVTSSGKPRIALDVGEDVVYFNNPDLPNTRSEMALPLHESGEIIGALDVQSTEPNAFSDDDLEVLTTLSELVTVAIQNAKLNEQMERSLAESEAISRQYFRQTWERLSEENQVTGFRYTASGPAPIGPSSNGTSESAEERKTISVPIIIRDETIGELSVLIPKDENIKADQMDLIRAVADRVAVIAENARLFDETTRRAERERLVTDITTKIRETNDPKAMIETAIKELREALNVTRIEIIPQKSTSPDR